MMISSPPARSQTVSYGSGSQRENGRLTATAITQLRSRITIESLRYLRARPGNGINNSRVEFCQICFGTGTDVCRIYALRMDRTGDLEDCQMRSNLDVRPVVGSTRRRTHPQTRSEE